ncbi:arginyl-tRNA synthetase [Coemansia sp. RSA 1939]|nr:arginyl-tRNA synthetase [Coemansia sp. RSA 1939]KAJ2594671.1 arginyl-tRNA synthetase [Coemansia sp. RSA 1804]KAJ2683435.1 arginyl-tRNA synthetase [Coemansia sp. RSA 1285]
MYDDFKTLIAAQLSELSGASAEIITPAIDLPKATTFGDLAVAVPRLRLKGNPVQLAQSLAEQFKTDDSVTGVVATGPYLNFRINRTAFTQKVLKAVHSAGEKYGWTNEGAGKRVIVEFSSPNIAKPFHAGHLRSTIIGNFIYKLHKANGWDAISMNYLGDWGKQYGLLAIGFNRFGSEEKLVADPITHLYEVYVAINAAADKDPTIHDEARAYFKKMEDGDESALALWQRFRDLSIAKYKQTYARLGIHFDVYSGESQVGEGMARAMQMLENGGLLTQDKGAKVLDLEKYKLEKAVVQKSDGTTLYLTRDIGAAIERYEKYNFDKIIYVVSSQQDLHLKQLFKTIELLGLPYADRFQHINYGLVKGMSTRKGTVVFLDDMLMESKDNMHSVMRENDAKYKQVADPDHVADVLGMTAIAVQDMSAKRIKDYTFEWSRILNFEGDTGPYLQYAHARLCSLERNCGPVNLEADVSLLVEESAREIVTLVSRYPDTLATAMQTLEPCTVVQYMLKLSHAVSAAWETMIVRDQPKELADARLLMYSSARIVIGNALSLLGMEPVQRM